MKMFVGGPNLRLDDFSAAPFLSRQCASLSSGASPLHHSRSRFHSSLVKISAKPRKSSGGDSQAANGVPASDSSAAVSINKDIELQLETESVATVSERKKSKKNSGKEEVLVPFSRTRAAVLKENQETGGGHGKLKNVLIVHTGGTLGMDPSTSFEIKEDNRAQTKLKPGTGGIYKTGLQPGYLDDLLVHVPELELMANIDLRVVFNMDSSRVGPNEWIKIGRILHIYRKDYDAFIVVHGTDTMAYTASAISLILVGFGKPIVFTGSQLPLLNPRTDARQNLIDSLTCATAGMLHEVAICFGGLLLRGNRAQKTSTQVYRAFASITYPPLATLGVDVEWNKTALLEEPVAYRPRFKLESNVIRVPIIPGVDPRIAYGDIAARGVRGIVVEAFGTGNMPDQRNSGWLPWLRDITKKGVLVYLTSQCQTGTLSPELYKSGSMALKYGVFSANQMTPECAAVKLMLCLAHHDLQVDFPFAGEL